MIHNPNVNEDLKANGIQFLQDTNGKQLIPFESITKEDIEKLIKYMKKRLVFRGHILPFIPPLQKTPRPNKKARNMAGRHGQTSSVVSPFLMYAM